MTAFIRGDSYCYSVSFILGHDCTAEFNKGIIITVFGGMFFESASNYENKIQYTAHYFNFFVFWEEMI